MSNDKRLIKKLTKIGVLMTSERNISKILEMILRESIELSNCDGGSIYIKEIDENSVPVIKFKNAINFSRKIEFKEFSLNLDKNSIAGFVALNGEILVLDDVDNIDPILELKYNDSFDKMINYKTVNMAVIPMISYDNEVVGVLQLINKRKNAHLNLINLNEVKEQIDSFNSEELEIIESLAAQAGILIERTKLYDEIQELLGSFIQAMVATLDTRDITTSGHSKRLAGYALKFAEVINQVDYGVYKDIFFSKEEIKELYYSALLHDIGKIGVKEAVLQKRTKLTENTIETLEYRFRFLINALALKNELNDFEKEIVEKPEKYLDIIRLINNKPFITDEEEDLLQKINNLEVNFNGIKYKFFKKEEIENLTIKKGNLTDDEREEINSHVSYSYKILKDIKWIKELKNIPDIASSHHERIDGTGYPRRLKGNEISIQAKILAILDIFEALTARDRPYKPPMSVEKAIEIIKKEVEDNHLDKELFQIFMQEKIYELYKEELNKIIKL